MSDAVDRQEIITSLTNAGKALGLLAKDDTIFRATVDAFRAVDGESFQRLLTTFKITDCELVCFWLRSKECVLECIELCGPPRQPITVEDIPRFAEVIGRITGDEELIERLADTVRDRDARGFASLVKELKIEPFCHLLCHWACMVHWRLVCEVVCAPRPIPQKDFVAGLATAGAAVRGLLEDRRKLASVIKAAVAFDCQSLGGIVGQQGDCFYICEWICSWHCILVCLPLCRPFPPIAETSIEEMRAFAQAAARLAAKEGAFAGLVDAVLAQNADAFAGLVKQLEVAPFCLQLCHWICFISCKRLCICVCGPVPTIPLFTHVGAYKITTDFAVDGTTVAGNLAFTTTIPLIGILPDGTAPDPLEYRFTYETYPLGGAPQETTTMIPASRIGELEYFEWNSTLSSWVVNSADYWVNNPGAAVDINQPAGPPLHVELNKNVKAGGWIEVPRENNLVFGGVGRFIPSDLLANLDTAKLSDESFDLTVAAPPLPLKAGDAVQPIDMSTRPLFKINFETRKVGTVALLNANSLNKIAISNTHFRYIRHLDWAGYTVAPPSGDSILVLSLDVQELLAGGCSPLGKDVHALFTAYHPYLGTCQVYLEGPGIPPPAAVSPPISADDQAMSPAGGQDFDISGLGPCAYIVWISATLRLTVGYGAVYGTFYDHIAFCKR